MIFINEYRERSGMTQRELAEKIGVSPSTVGMYEQGRREPNIEMLVKLARAFGCSLDELILGKSERRERRCRGRRKRTGTI